MQVGHKCKVLVKYSSGKVCGMGANTILAFSNVMYIAASTMVLYSSFCCCHGK